MESFENVPVIDFATYFDKNSATPDGRWEEECKKVADSFHNFGILIVRDPRVHEKDNDEYIDLME